MLQANPTQKTNCWDNSRQEHPARGGLFLSFDIFAGRTPPKHPPAAESSAQSHPTTSGSSKFGISCCKSSAPKASHYKQLLCLFNKPIHSDNIGVVCSAPLLGKKKKTIRGQGKQSLFW